MCGNKIAKAYARVAVCSSHIILPFRTSLMMKGRNNGKKLLALRIVAHAFEIIHLLTDQNPIQVLVDAIVNTGPREDSTRIGSQGTVRRQAVDVSPLRRVNQAIALLTIGVSIYTIYFCPGRADKIRMHLKSFFYMYIYDCLDP